MYLKFPISNGEIHSTNETLNKFPNYIVTDFYTDSSTFTDTDEPLCTSQVQKLNDNLETPWKPKCLKNLHTCSKIKSHAVMV